MTIADSKWRLEMQTTKLSASLVLAWGMFTALLSTAASANVIGGKNDLVCASVSVIGCTEGDCIEGQAGTFDMPKFMFVDVKRKLVHTNDKDGKEVGSPIKNFEVTEDSVILQGIENHKGWTLGIERESGHMTLSATGAEVSFMVFGNCIER
jgi:hypothetical protein